MTQDIHKHNQEQTLNQNENKIAKPSLYPYPGASKKRWNTLSPDQRKPEGKRNIQK